jgi:hypothetical protein
MTTFTAKLFTPVDWAETDIIATTPQEALKAAQRLADEDLGVLDFAGYDSGGGVEHIEVFDADGHPVAEWRHPDLRVRLAAPALLEALEAYIDYDGPARGARYEAIRLAARDAVREATGDA